MLTRDATSGAVKIYIDGALNKNGTTDSGVVGTGFNKLGVIEDTYGTPEYFQGYLDEVKIYDNILTDAQVKAIYDSEKKGKNYDGSNRTTISCGCIVDNNIVTTPLEFEGNIITLNSTINTSNTWTHIDFKKPITSTPVVFVVAENTGTHPATVKIKNVTKTGFDAIMAESQGEDGPHLQ